MEQFILMSTLQFRKIINNLGFESDNRYQALENYLQVKSTADKIT